MSVSAISSANCFVSYNHKPAQNNFQQIQQELLQLGQDLQSGNLAQAQTDYSALQQLFPGQPQNIASATSSGAPSGPTAANSVSAAIAQLGQDLSAGNVSAARSDLAALQQNLQQQGAVSTHRVHHHGLHGSPIFENQNSPATLFGELGQDIAAGNVTAAQQTYSALQQDFLQFIGGASASGSVGASAPSARSTNLSVSV